MKELILSDIHKKLGAKMVPFANYKMPIQYKSGVNEEHNTVRNSVGLFDVSHMGEIFISGERSLEYLQYISSNDVGLLSPGKVQYSYLPNEIGGIVDDFLLYMISKNYYLMVINGSNIEKDLNWINKHNVYDCKVENESDNYSLFAIQGPKSISLLQQLTDTNLSDIKYYNFKIGSINHIDNIIISRTGYTGEIGFEIYVKNEDAVNLWNSLFETSIELIPIGLAARDTLRLEKGYCLYGNDISEETSPIEAGLGWITKFNNKFINCENLEIEKKTGVERKLVGIELIEKGIARKDYIIEDENENEIGLITSGTMSPTLKIAIAMAYINVAHTKVGTEVFVNIRNKKIKANIVSIPFVK
ncbi:glycine cleavage system aminomethyltransferase GcvT [Flavobacteriales bacterium]|nr:glycine cleavage system aminomethyltransferase GcvT [Flavobacteriales bacterium]